MALGWVASLRDWIVIVWGLLSIFAFAFLIFFLVTLYFGVRDLMRTVKVLVNDDVRPIVATGRETVYNVTGTTRFLSDTVVQPVIRVYSFLSGLRRFITVFLGLTGRGKRGKPEAEGARTR